VGPRRIGGRRRAPCFMMALLLFWGAVSGIGMIPTASAQAPATAAAVPATSIVELMVVIYNPIIESQGGKRLTEVLGWNSPDLLTSQFTQDLGAVSHGAVEYQVTRRVERDEWPLCRNGNRYTDELYLSEWNARSFTVCPGPGLTNPPQPYVDYNAIISDNGVVTEVANGNVDEVFVWAFPGSGFYESVMAGDGAYWINGTPVTGVGGRPFVVMGLNYERGLAEAAESYGHRVESMLSKKYGRWQPIEGNDWERFTLLDRDVAGRGGIGNAHNAFNAEPGTDYNRTSTRSLSTSADDWNNFPAMTGVRTAKNCTAWACDAYGYLEWWYDHMPHVEGATSGILNNWWTYIVRPDRVLTPKVPGELTASALNNTTARVRWTDHANDEWGFWLFVDRSYTPPNLGANTTSVDVGALQPGRRYCFNVETFNGAGGSLWDDPACLTMPGGVSARPADFDGNGTSDVAVYRPAEGAWYRQGQAPIFFGGPTDVPVPADFDGNGSSDIAVYRPSVGGWYRQGESPVFFGLSTDIPVPGDYSGGGGADTAVYRPSVGGWYRQGQSPVFFGLSTDVPVPGDYDGNGATDIAVFRPAVGGWYRHGQGASFFGLPGDIPVPGDYDGDGTTDIAVYRPSVGGWYRQGQSPVFFGLSSDVPVPGDYDGNGTTDIAVYRPSVGGWYRQGQSPVFFGAASDQPLALPAAVYSAYYASADGLAPLIDSNDRVGIRNYLAPRSVQVINSEVAALDQSRRDRLADVVLDSTVTGDRRSRLLAAMRVALNHPDLRFYAEIWSYTRIDVGSTPGLFFSCSSYPTGYLNLEQGAFDGFSSESLRNVLLHESFHAFNCHEDGPNGALNEGAAIWIFKAAFPQGLNPAETFAEATYGTKLFYRDIGVGQPDPNYPLQAPSNPKPKLVEELTRLSQADPSKLPWNSQTRLTSCFEQYWQQINRNQDYQSYLQLAQAATDAMLQNPSCRPL
jgi:hypothetical protein